MRVKKTKNKKIFAIVVSRFNEHITKNLLKGCLKEFDKENIDAKNIKIVWVPGAWEIPVTAFQLAQQRNVSAVICLGSIIRGQTAHFDFVAQGCCQGIQNIALLTGKPIILGVLTTYTVRQAQQRSQISGNNKGCEAAHVAIDMVQTLEKL